MAAAVLAPASVSAQTTLLNVSYDPTRELYRAINQKFDEECVREDTSRITVRMSHGGSGSQARAVIDGLDADVVTLALAADIDEIARRTKKIPADWQKRLPNNSAPYTSTIVFLVRKGNPKGIGDWDDLIKPGIQVMTPNPKTSGGARWNYLAAYAYGAGKPGGEEPRRRPSWGRSSRTHPVLDTGARGSTNTFARRGIGDVLLAWENEAFLALDELGADKFDIVVPSISILAEPPVTVVDGNVDRKGTFKARRGLSRVPLRARGAGHYRQELLPPGQARGRGSSRMWRGFPTIKLDHHRSTCFGGWDEAQRKHFADGGIFDTDPEVKPLSMESLRLQRHDEMPRGARRFRRPVPSRASLSRWAIR